MWVAPLLLAGVAGIAVAGRVAGNVPVAPAVQPTSVPVPGVAAAPSLGPRAALGIPYRHGREEGTDGLMGGLPFGLPGDTPLVRLDRVNRFTVDDVSMGWSVGPGMPPGIHRVGGLPSFVSDPYAR